MFYVLDESRIDRDLKVVEARPFILGAETRPQKEPLHYTSLFGAHTDVFPSYAAQEGVHLLGYYTTTRTAPRPATPEEKERVRQTLAATKIKTMQKTIAEAVR